MRSPCYKPATCCKGVRCYYENDREFCWGQVEVVDEIRCLDKDDNEDYMWIHACEGHAGISYGELYKKKEES